MRALAKPTPFGFIERVNKQNETKRNKTRLEMADLMSEKQRKAFGKMKPYQKSVFSTLHGVKAIARITKKTWSLAKKCPMYTKRTVDKKTGKKATIRTNRLINSHAWKVAASGSAQWAHAVLTRESKAFRINHEGESQQAPFLPSFSPGAIAIFEQFLCAYAQDATRNAVSIRDGLNTHKRLNAGLMKLGFAQTNERVFQSCMPVPRNLVICKPPKKVVGKDGKKTNEEDGDSKAPVEE